MKLITKNPAISVVIPSYNEEKFLERALKSLQKQSFKNFEVIVVDNNSTDAGVYIAGKYGARVILEQRQGVGYARQAGFIAARAELIASMDADTIAPNEWLQKIISRFDSNPNLVAFGGLYKLYSGPITARLFFPHLASFFWKMDYRINKGWSLPGANMAVKKSAFILSGGFDQHLKINEDARLSQKLKEYGEVHFDPKFLVHTSGRRYRNGLAAGLWGYIPNTVVRLFGRKDRFNNLKTIRNEQRSWYAYVLSFVFVAALTFLALGYGISEAKEGMVKTIQAHTVAAHRIIY